jgi:hypothetical protein
MQGPNNLATTSERPYTKVAVMIKELQKKGQGEKSELSILTAHMALAGPLVTPNVERWNELVSSARPTDGFTV